MHFLDRGTRQKHKTLDKKTTYDKTKTWLDKLNGYKQKPIHGKTKRSNRTRATWAKRTVKTRFILFHGIFYG